MTFSSTKANGNIRYYSEKHLQDLDYEGRFVDLTLEYSHYGYIAKNIHMFSGEKNYFFAKQPAGYIYIGEGEVSPSTLGLPKIPEKYRLNMMYVYLGKHLESDENHQIDIEQVTPRIIKDITQYLIDYYDIAQLLMHDEFEQGRTSGDTEPQFDMSKYLQTTSATLMDSYSVPYHIHLPVHKKEIVITNKTVMINALS